MSKEFEQKKVKIGETEYTLQMAAASWYLRINDECSENNSLKRALYTEKLLENVVISPKVTSDDFTGRARELLNLVNACEGFLLGDEIKGEIKNGKAPTSDSTAKG